MTMSFAFGNGGGSESGSSTPPEAQARNEDLPTVCRRINTKLSLFLEKPSAGNERLQSVQEQTRISLMVIAKAVEVYGLEHIALSFNGGKDCLVLLILLLAVLDEYYTAVDGNQQAKDTEKAASRFSADQVYPETDPSLVTFSTPPTPPSPKKSPNVSSRTTPFQIPTVYIHSSHPFAEVDSFVDRCVDEYHLNLLRFDEKSGMKNAFKVYLAGNPDVRLILVGTRRTDPHGGLLKHFDMTDGGWPEFMRCHGVIDWHYRDIWAFLKELEIPYCPLYDLGYTSLGGTTDTHPNPALQRSLEEGVPEDAAITPARRKSLSHCFRPAYELEADAEERLGRDR